MTIEKLPRGIDGIMFRRNPRKFLRIESLKKSGDLGIPRQVIPIKILQQELAISDDIPQGLQIGQVTSLLLSIVFNKRIPLDQFHSGKRRVFSDRFII